MLGTRGVPAAYSGFETCVEQLGARLVERGHDVTVYCRTQYIRYEADVYRGMRLVKLPTLRNKYLDTPLHTAASSLHALFGSHDVALYFIAANSPATWIPRLAGTRTILNVDGLDWKRKKWPAPAKLYIRLAEYLATKLPDRFVTDSTVVASYYRSRLGAEAAYIPYGSEVERVEPGAVLERWRLEPRRYLLFVGRLVPENCVEHLIEAFRSLSTDMKCVIVGDAPYAASYIRELHRRAEPDPRIVFTGYQFGDAYRELGSSAYAFVATTGVGGTHPAILEAMGFGSCVVVNGTPENLETIGDAGLSYAGSEGSAALRAVLERLLESPELVERYRAAGAERARREYSWERVADDYERLMAEVTGARRAARPGP